MIIRPYDPAHLEGVVRLSLRAWAPVFDSLKQVFAAIPGTGRHALRTPGPDSVCSLSLVTSRSCRQDHEPQSP